MTQVQAQQINRLLASPISVSGVSVVGSSVVVTSDITTACNTAGNGGVSVPFQVSTSSSVMGVITSGNNNKCMVYNYTNASNIQDASGNEVYGRLTQTSNIYTISFYSLINGTETAYNFVSTTLITYVFRYIFDFYRIPYDALISFQQFNLDQAVASVPNKHRDNLVITTLNTVPNLSAPPIAGVDFFINGVCHSTVASSPAFSVSGQIVTFNSSNASQSLSVGTELIANYESFS